MLRYKFFPFLVSLLFLNSYSAMADDDSALCASGYTVFFGNGVNTEIIGTRASAGRTKSMLGTDYGGEPITYKTSHNPTDGVLLDLLESFDQKRSEDPTLSWQLFFRWVSGQTITSTLSIMLDDYFGTNGAQRISNAAGRLSSPSGFTDRTVVEHAGTYESELLAGKRVMIVSHSQGNLYSNAVYRKLVSQNSGDYDIGAIGIAAVASPANSVASNDGYVTSDTDLIIDAVRLVAPATLPSNDNSVPFLPSSDRLGHGFREIYTSQAYPTIRIKALGVMRSTLSRIAQAQTLNTAGPITATLTWSTPGDIDLHSYEPNGSHVFYSAPRGVVGSLDRDDTSGTGPEHYYSSCENFEEGSYRFGVNYFSGSGSKTATIKMSVLGVDYPSRSIVVTTPRYSSGNNSPSILFNVSISRDENENFKADVF